MFPFRPHRAHTAIVSTTTGAPPPNLPSPAPPAVVVGVEVVSGPAVGPPCRLGPGSYVVGRASSARIRLDDPTVEAHHLLVDVDPTGRTRAIQLTGRSPVLVDDRPLEGHGVLEPGQELSVGTTRLRIEPVHHHDLDIDAALAVPAPVTVARSPRSAPVLAVDPIGPVAIGDPPPPMGAHPGMLIGSMAGLAGGVVLALVTRSPIVLVMGAVTASVSASTWVVGRVRRGIAERRWNRHRAESDEQLRSALAAAAAAVRQHHERSHPPIAHRLAAAPGTGLWERRPHHGDAFTVSLGRGDLERPLPAERAALPTSALALLDAAAMLTDVEIPARLDDHDRHVIAISGRGAHGVARSVVLQLATATGPADWVLRAVVERPGDHGWLRDLPHAVTEPGLDPVVAVGDPAGAAAMIGALDDGDDRRVVFVCDAPALLTNRIGSVRRLLDRDRPVTILLVDEGGGPLPAVCRSVLRLGEHGVGRWTADLDDAGATEAWGEQRLRPSAVPLPAAERLAARLSWCRDPELLAATSSDPPRSVGLGWLAQAGFLPWTSDEILDAWAAGGSDPPPVAVLGLGGGGPGADRVDPDDVIDLDLVRDGPHGLIAGTTGSGKSELLRTLVVSLAARTDPRLLSFVLVDYKGGATFDACAELPHTVGVVTDLDEGLAARALISLDAELRRRERILRERGAADLHAARSGPDPVLLPRLVVVIDEFAALAKELPGFLAALVDVAQRGRSLGIHLLLATQRPAGVIDDAIRANTNLRIALRLHDAADALDVVGDRAPTRFPRAVPGRAVVRLGPDELVEFQSASCTLRPAGDRAEALTASAAASDLDTLVANVREAAGRSGFAGSHRPWLPPLDDPSVPPPDDGAIGWVDDPAGQCRRPLRWDRTGHLALVGAIGSGTTTALRALARDCPVVHVIDGRGDRALGELDPIPTCSGVIGVDDRERVDRLLRRLVTTIDERRTHGRDGSEQADEVLLVDGYEALRRSLDEPDRIDPDGASSSAARLRRILAEGAPVGVLVAAVVEPEGGGASLARFHERWLFHVDDPAVAGLVGVTGARVPPSTPGRLVVCSTGLDARVWMPPPMVVTTDRSVPRIGSLPAHVTAEALGVTHAPGCRDHDDERRRPRLMLVGQRFDDLASAWFEWLPGEPVVIAGPRRSGRSTLVEHLAAAWQASQPDGTVTVVDVAGVSHADGPSVGTAIGVAELAERSAALAGRPHLVVVDDADRIEDRDGVLARLAAARPDGSTALLLAGRADALRAFDHWSAPARRRRCGFVMTATSDLDGDVLGVAPPRRCPITPRAGLAWMIAHGDCSLVQTLAPPAPR